MDNEGVLDPDKNPNAFGFFEGMSDLLTRISGAKLGTRANEIIGANAQLQSASAGSSFLRNLTSRVRFNLGGELRHAYKNPQEMALWFRWAHEQGGEQGMRDMKNLMILGASSGINAVNNVAYGATTSQDEDYR